MKKIPLILMIFILSVGFSFAGFFSKKKKIVYRPVTNLSFDDAFAVAKCYLDKHNLLVRDFSYSKGYLISSFLSFSDLLIKKRARIKFFYKDNLLQVQLVDMQEEDGHGGWDENATCLTKKPERIKAKIAKELQEIANNPDMVNKCRENFYNDMNIHYLFLKKATGVAAKRWFKKYMKDRVFKIELSFDDLKENSDLQYKKFKYKLIGDFYPKGSMFSHDIVDLSDSVLVILYTNSDRYVMASKHDKIEISGKCKDVYLDKVTGAMVIVLTAN